MRHVCRSMDLNGSICVYITMPLSFWVHAHCTHTHAHMGSLSAATAAGTAVNTHAHHFIHTVTRAAYRYLLVLFSSEKKHAFCSEKNKVAITRRVGCDTGNSLKIYQCGIYLGAAGPARTTAAMLASRASGSSLSPEFVTSRIHFGSCCGHAVCSPWGRGRPYSGRRASSSP